MDQQEKTKLSDGKATFKRIVYNVVEIAKDREHDRVSWYFDIFIVALIGLNIFAVMIETVDWIGRDYHTLFIVFEYVSVAIFTVEYLARIWTCTFHEEYQHPLWGRLSFMFSLFPLIDLIAILPTYYQLFVPVTMAIQTRQFRIFRFVRFARVLKLGRYSKSVRTMTQVFTAKKEELFITLIMVSGLLVFSSSCIYFFENEAQPDKFSSIPASMWWGVATLTTVGYGDVYPITNGGRFFAAIIAVLGIGVFALPAGILASGFADVLDEKRQNKLRGPQPCPHCGLDTRLQKAAHESSNHEAVEDGIYLKEEAHGQAKETQEKD
jgi:voltage-gated potassium channel